MNITSKSQDSLGRALTAVTFGHYPIEQVRGCNRPEGTDRNGFSAEGWYKHNKTTDPAKNIRIMAWILMHRFLQYPETRQQVERRGGAQYLRSCRHHPLTGTEKAEIPRIAETIRNWEGDGFDSGFIRALTAAYVLATPRLHFPMKYRMPHEALRPDLRPHYPNGTSCLQLMRDGHRTSTTRRKFAQEGSVVAFGDNPKTFDVYKDGRGRTSKPIQASSSKSTIPPPSKQSSLGSSENQMGRGGLRPPRFAFFGLFFNRT